MVHRTYHGVTCTDQNLQINVLQIVILANRADADSVVLHLGLHCLPMYPFQSFQYIKGINMTPNRPPNKLECVTENYFLISQPKHMLWVLKRKVSMRHV